MVYIRDAESHRVVVRAMDRRGYYPRDSFLTEHAIFINDYHTVFSAVHALPDKDYLASELSWATIEEIRLWAAMALSCPENKGYHAIYPSGRSVSIDPLELPSWNLADEDCQEELRTLLVEGSDRLTGADRISPYSRHHHPTDQREQIRLLRSIEDSEHREPELVRGLVCFLKSAMLFDHWQYGEEAALAVFTAMEGALSTMRNRLSATGGRPASFDDVHSVIQSHIRYGDGLSSYFRDCWEKRIILAHPDNKFGAEPIPFLYADDFYDTYKALVSVYRLLLIGEQRPEYD
jgi:hypothetical protein